MKQVTITIPDHIYAEAQRAVRYGNAASVADYLASLVRRPPAFLGIPEYEPDWEEGRKIVAEMIAEVGGLTPEAKAWSRATLGLDEVSEVANEVALEPIAV